MGESAWDFAHVTAESGSGVGLWSGRIGRPTGILRLCSGARFTLYGSRSNISGVGVVVYNVGDEQRKTVEENVEGLEVALGAEIIGLGEEIISGLDV